MIEIGEGVINSAVSDVPVWQLKKVDIPGLRPAVYDSEGKVIEPDNLGDLTEEARAIFDEKPWYRTLLAEVRQHQKSAIFVTVLGGITIFVATAAGFEFGLRHGQDLRHLPRILRRKK